MLGLDTARSFITQVNKKICLSISSFHPETWQPSWGIRTALVALMAFFNAEVRFMHSMVPDLLS